MYKMYIDPKIPEFLYKCLLRILFHKSNDTSYSVIRSFSLKKTNYPPIISINSAIIFHLRLEQISARPLFHEKFPFTKDTNYSLIIHSFSLETNYPSIISNKFCHNFSFTFRTNHLPSCKIAKTNPF